MVFFSRVVTIVQAIIAAASDDFVRWLLAIDFG